MSQNRGSPPSTNGSTAAGEGPFQDKLGEWCKVRGLREPNFQLMSDRRGGRTAWSCTVYIENRPIDALFWYDGNHINGAREDAAQVALQRLNVIPQTGTPSGQQTQQQQGQQRQGNGAAGHQRT